MLTSFSMSQAGWGRITALVVDAEARRLGVGRTLIDRAANYFRDRGCVHIEVTSADHRPGAHAFYRSVGFVEDERRFVKNLEPRNETKPNPK
jgi:ribosomal protein S18 acetylase RimI-like enzyme